jgi:hypothetical protein
MDFESGDVINKMYTDHVGKSLGWVNFTLVWFFFLFFWKQISSF